MLAFCNQYIAKYGISHSFISTAWGGFLFCIAGFYANNIGLMLTGALIFVRGLSSEIARRALVRGNYSEEIASLPGITIAAIMNWPAFFTADSFEEHIAFGLAGLAMTLKFVQYIEELKHLIPKQNKSFIDLLTRNFLDVATFLNRTFFNVLNKYIGFAVLISFFIYASEALRNENWLSLTACLFLVYGGMTLALKTRQEVIKNSLYVS